MMTYVRTNILFFRTVLLLAGLLAGAPALAGAFSWEADSLPAAGGWTPIQQYCEPVVWLDDGWYFQELDDDACPSANDGAQDTFRRALVEYSGHPTFFVEWRVEASGPASELDFVAPTSLTVFGSDGVHYGFTVARDIARLNRGNLLPIILVSIAPNIPHTHRLVLEGSERFTWFVDGAMVTSGTPTGQFPGPNPLMNWRGYSRNYPTLNRWSYVRYGDVPGPGSFDYDTSGTVDEFDLYYFQECFLDPGIQSWPGCEFADVNDDDLVDCTDWDALLAAWDGPEPPSVDLCAATPADVPTVTRWGTVCMTVVFLAFLTVRARGARALHGV